MERDKRGQAAMEFLMTYGWAILAAIIAIGVLVAFGVFSPGKFAQESPPTLSAPFNGKAAVVNTTGIQIEVLQNLGETVNVTSITISNCNTAGQVIGTNLAASANIVYYVPCTSALTSGDSFKGDITISYKRAGGTLELQSTGSITSKVK